MLFTNLLVKIKKITWYTVMHAWGTDRHCSGYLFIMWLVQGQGKRTVRTRSTSYARLVESNESVIESNARLLESNASVVASSASLVASNERLETAMTLLLECGRDLIDRLGRSQQNWFVQDKTEPDSPKYTRYYLSWMWWNIRNLTVWNRAGIFYTLVVYIGGWYEYSWQ